MRAINAVRELNEERDEPIRLIALYTEQERHALFVRQADERHCLGPAMVEDGDGKPLSAYLDYERLERALVETEADAAWVGWGFVAEHPAFAELCEQLGIVFVGPEPEVMRVLGDKIEGKRLAEQAGVPVAAWSGGPVESAEDAVRHAEQLGYPLMIKAAAGGGGRGMRKVERRDQIEEAFERARAEAASAFGDPSVLMERLVGAARHVEVQLMADGQGGVWALGVRDCSYQRRHQKVVEESASPVLTPEQERELAESATRLAREAGYRGAGTVEFLYEPDTKQLLVHGGQHPAPGRAPRHGAGDRRRPRPAPAPRRRGRPARGRPAAAARPRDRGPPQRRGPGPRLRARARPHRPAAAPQRPRHPRRHRRRRGRHGAARVRLDDRQDHRPRQHPRAGDRAPAPRGRRHDGGDRRGHHQPGLPARAARPARAAQGRGRHGLARPPPGAGRRPARPPRRRRARPGRDRAVRRGDRHRPRPVLRAGPPRPPAGRGRGLPHRRPAPPRRELPLRRLPDRSPPLPRRAGRHADRGRPSSASRSTSAGSPTAASPTAR